MTSTNNRAAGPAIDTLPSAAPTDKVPAKGVAFAVSREHFAGRVQALQDATHDNAKGAFVDAGVLLARLKHATEGLTKGVLGAALRLVHGMPARDAVRFLKGVEKAMRDKGAAGASSIRLVTKAAADCADAYGEAYELPEWSSAKEAREASAAATGALASALSGDAGATTDNDNDSDSDTDTDTDSDTARASARTQAEHAEVEELRAVAEMLRVKLGLPEGTTPADLLVALDDVTAQ